MIWFWGVLCALALVALFFPFVFWVDFSADFGGVTVHVRFFNKHLYTYEKKFGKKDSLEDEEPEKELETEKEPNTSKSTLETKTELETSAPAPVTKVDKAEPKSEPKTEEKKTEVSPKVESKPEEKKPETKIEASSEEKSEDEKEEKRSLTDQEFWTLLLTPEFDVRAWWAVRHELSAIFKLFRIRFVDCFVEGLRMEYEKMGYAAALNGFLKSFPYIGDWDFRMDWTHDHEPKAEGHMRSSVNVCRMLGLILATLFYGGIVAWTFWRRRAHILKTGELPELGFIRNKIVKLMSEDD